MELSIFCFIFLECWTQLENFLETFGALRILLYLSSSADSGSFSVQPVILLQGIKGEFNMALPNKINPHLLLLALRL